MNWQSLPFKSWFHLLGLIVLYGLACLVAWLVAPWLGFSFVGQLGLIGLILFTWLLTLVFEKVRRMYWPAETDQTQQLQPGNESMGDGPANLPGQGEAFAMLTDWVETTCGRKTQDRFRQPWFGVIGPPASGKSALLLTSQLDFQLLPHQRPADLYTIAPTTIGECYVSESAVYLDLPGHLVADTAQNAAWKHLCQWLGEYRDTRPVDGLVIVADAHRLCSLAESDIEQEAKILRARLDECLQWWGHQFPLYLVFSHSDKLAGFAAFFEEYDRGERSQVWGATIPLEQQSTGYALFDTEFGYLYEALMRRRLLRLSTATTPLDQLLVYEFPIRFYETRKKLGLFYNILFRPSSFRQSPWVRGFYFTGYHPGEGQSEPVPADALPADTDPTDAEPVAIVNQRKLGTRYFGEEFFTEVLLADKDLAAYFQPQPTLPRYAKPAMASAMVLTLVLFLAGLARSYRLNGDYVAEVEARSVRVTQLQPLQLAGDSEAASKNFQLTQLEALETLRQSLMTADAHDQTGRPWLMQSGLYVGDDIASAGRRVYFDALQQAFCRPVFLQLESDLRAFAADSTPNTDEASLSQHYDRLKTYLMLSQPARAKGTFLYYQLSPYWKGVVPAEGQPLALKQLEFYALHATDQESPHLKGDELLIRQVRQRLLAYPAVSRFYKQFISEIDARVPAVTLETMLAGRGAGVLQGDYSVPGSFTLEGYRDYAADGLDAAALELAKSDWVMGETGTNLRGASIDVTRLREMYFREYTAHWQRFLKDTQVRPFKSREEAIEILTILAEPESPLVVLLTEVSRQVQPTNIGSGGLIQWVTSKVSTQKKPVTTEVEREFAPLLLFLNTSPGNDGTPVSQYRVALRSILDTLQITSNDQLNQASRTLLTGKDDLGLLKAEAGVTKVTETFRTDSTRILAGLLYQPLGNLRALLYGTNGQELSTLWTQQLYPQAIRLKTGYPFTNDGGAPLTEVARFLNPQDGLLASVLRERLAGSFEDVNGEWKLKPVGAVRVTPDFVGFLNQSRRLQETLFSHGGRTPEIAYELTLQPSGTGKIKLEVDGVTLESQAGTPQSGKLTWPAKSGSTTGARLSVTIPGGATQEMAFPGEWGMFQLIENGKPAPAGPNQFSLTWNIQSVTVTAILRSPTAVNPFDRQLFASFQPPPELFAR
ncbi:MAG TPA: type VI secretion system membrane subunit TssM [Acidobacteriota bacterium]|nr:type VI secretion system membrane subunit TssM [Acidobacteriota bacterium]